MRVDSLLPGVEDRRNRDGEATVAWHLEGSYFENCNCDVACPCAVTSFVLPATNERCQLLFAFHVVSGEIDGVDVGGLSLGILGDTPGQMTDGGWRVGVLMDEKASDAQAQALAAVFGGQKGGPMGEVAPLIGEMLGMERAAIEYVDEGSRHTVKIGDSSLLRWRTSRQREQPRQRSSRGRTILRTQH